MLPVVGVTDGDIVKLGFVPPVIVGLDGSNDNNPAGACPVDCDTVMPTDGAVPDA
jgi:hypothetical protein